MIIYFVRHGEGHHNLSGLYGAPHFELTERGKEQALGVSERMKNLPIQILVVSPYKRTVQTAEIIRAGFASRSEKSIALARRTLPFAPQKVNQGLPEIILSELAIEIIRPKEIAGKRIDDPENMAIRKQLDDNFHIKDYHFSNEENFYDLSARAKKFLKYLETFEQKHKHIAVITHAVFLRMLVLIIILKDELTPRGFLNGYAGMHLATSGLTVCEKDEKGWKLITWNDQSHLGE